MKEYKRTSFVLDEETFNFLNNFNQKFKIPRSAVMRTLLKIFINNEEGLLELIKKE